MPSHEQARAQWRGFRTGNGAAKSTLLTTDLEWAHSLAAGGEMGARIRSFDWPSTPLGPISEWPSSLREAVSLCLRSRFQLAIYWGPQLVLLYNDAERDVLGALHPLALGRPAAEVLADFWDVFGPMLHGVLTTGDATWSEDQSLRINRRGFLEESFFTYSCSPIPDRSSVGGVLLMTFETTQRVLAERALRTLREVAAETAGAQSAEEACGRAAGVLSGNRSDFPFSLLFLTEGNGRFRLCGSTGIAGAADPDLWPLAEVSQAQQAMLLENVGSRLPGEKTVLPRSALVLPIMQAGKGAPTGCLVAGLSDFRALDEAYRGFLGLVAGQIANALAGAQARELTRANARLGKQVAKRKQAEKARTELLRRLVHAQEEERRRIARELHDDLTQRLAVLAIDAGTIEHLPGSPRDVGIRVRRMHEELVALSESVHSLSRQLHPAILDDLGLVDAVRSECLNLEQRDGIVVRYHAQDVPTNLPRGVALCVYRVAQEALRNVVRHARSPRASVRLVATTRELLLRVRDWGVGFGPAAQGRSGLGLASMQERARLIRARLKIRSQPGEGTHVTLRVPLQRSQP
jgi:signal transduction histidine kinase